MEWWFSAVAFILSTFLQGCPGIRIKEIKVPAILKVGDSGELDCIWEEDNDHMYSIKWYQAAHEFYRYTPTSAEPIQIFDPPTLDVDGSKSWGGSVRITNVTQTATGPFHCEVSADGPTFHTASDQANLTVVDVPDEDPEIQGVESHYSFGEWIELNCTSKRSHPPAHLSFHINDEPAPSGWFDQQVNSVDENGLTTSVLRLYFSLMPEQMREGHVRVKCTSDIQDIYHESTEEVLMTYRPYQASVFDGVTSGCGSVEVICLLSTLQQLLLLLWRLDSPYL